MRIAKMIASGVLGGGAAWTPDKPLTGGVLPGIWVKSDTGLFQDSGKTTPATADGEPIAVWDDISASNNDFATTTTGVPLLKIIAGVPFVYTDGVDGAMMATIAAGAAKTIFVIVKKATAADASARSVLSFDNSSAVYVKSTDGGDAAQWRYQVNQAAGVVALGGTATNLSVISLAYASVSSLSIKIDGGVATVLDPNDGYQAATLISIGERTGNGQSIDAYYMEILYYGSLLSDADIAKVEAYLLDRKANPI